MVVPARVPVPEFIAAVTAALELVTIALAASRMCTIGCVASRMPDAAPPGCLATASWAGREIAKVVAVVVSRPSLSHDKAPEPMARIARVVRLRMAFIRCSATGPRLVVIRRRSGCMFQYGRAPEQRRSGHYRAVGRRSTHISATAEGAVRFRAQAPIMANH